MVRANTGHNDVQTRYDTIEKFVNRYASSKSTRCAYRSGLKSFFQCLDINPDSYFSTQRNHGDDVEMFFRRLQKANRPPKTIQLYLAAVKMFLKYYKIKFDEDFWDDIKRRMKGHRARTCDRIPNIKESRAIISHMTIKGKALFLIQTSTGMRIGELLSICFEDVDLSKNPPEIIVRGECTKSGESRFVFISTEAKEALEQWLNVRQSYLSAAVRKSTRYSKKADDNRVFPFSIGTATLIWNNAVKKAGLEQLDPSTKRRVLHTHSNRKFFRNRMSNAGVPVDVIEAFMGHEGYLTDSYRHYTKEQLVQWYKKGEGNLLIYSDSGANKQFMEDLKKTEESSQQKLMQRDKEILELKKEYREEEEFSKLLFREIKSLERRLEEVCLRHEEEREKSAWMHKDKIRRLLNEFGDSSKTERISELMASNKF